MAFVYGPTNSDILNAFDGITSGDDHVEVMGRHDSRPKSVTALTVCLSE
jgi:hypothetical protein